MWELLVTDNSLQGLFRNFCRRCSYRSRSSSTGRHVCAGSIPLWALVCNRARRDKVGLARSAAAWGLCSGRKQGGTSLSAACLSLGTEEGHREACLCSTGLLCWWSAWLWPCLSSPRISCSCRCSRISLPCRSSLALHGALWEGGAVLQSSSGYDCLFAESSKLKTECAAVASSWSYCAAVFKSQVLQSCLRRHQSLALTSSSGWSSPQADSSLSFLPVSLELSASPQAFGCVWALPSQ